MISNTYMSSFSIVISNYTESCIPVKYTIFIKYQFSKRQKL